MARMSKKLVAEKGILSSPNPKCGHPLPTETENLVKEFYMNDDNSRIMPGKKDFVSIKTSNGRTHEQKRLILSNLKELHASFKTKNPDKKISFSKFATLRPRNCVLAGGSGTHSVCVCTIHQNPKLMLQACDLKSLQGTESAYTLSDYRSLLKQMICSDPSPKCYLGLCQQCPGVEKLHPTLIALFDENNIDTITYKQWTSTDGSSLETIVQSADDFVESLLDNLSILLRHSFIAKQQSLYLAHMKETMTPWTFVSLCDFSENFAFIVQDAAQSFHWNNNQATIHPFGFYFKDESGLLKNGNFVIISDCMEHDAISVNLFQKHVIQFLKDNYHEPSNVIYFSDGCAAQYKNRNHFLNISYHQSDFELQTEWHFFATSHGKSISDGLGGTLKRLAAKDSLQRPLNDQILTPKQLYEWAVANISGMNFHYVTNEEYIQHSKLMNDRFETSKVLVGTRKMHAIVPVGPDVVKAKIYSFASESVEHSLKAPKILAGPKKRAASKPPSTVATPKKIAAPKIKSISKSKKPSASEKTSAVPKKTASTVSKKRASAVPKKKASAAPEKTAAPKNKRIIKSKSKEPQKASSFNK